MFFVFNRNSLVAYNILGEAVVMPTKFIPIKHNYNIPKCVTKILQPSGTGSVYVTIIMII